MNATKFSLCASLAGALACTLLGMGSAGAREPDPTPLLDLAGHSCSAAPDFSHARNMVFDPKRDATQDTEITSDSICFQSAGGPALYVAYALPPAAVPYIVKVASLPEGTNLLAPQILLYGADGTPRRSYTRDAITFRGESLTALFRAHADEQYLVVASDPAAVGQNTQRISDSRSTTSMVVPVPGGIFFFSVSNGADSSFTYVYSHIGHIEVTLSSVPSVK